LTFVDQNYGESGIVMLTRRHILIALGVLPATAALGACGHSTSKTGGNAGTAVTFLTGYGTTPRETFPWVGLAKGFFSEAGIDLTVLPGQPSDANLKTLAAGKAQFAAVDFVSAIRGTKAFPDYRTVMAVQSSTLLSMVTLAGRGIGKPTDLAGRTLGTAPAAATQTLFPTYAKAAGFDPATDKFVNAPSDQLPSLLAAGRVDAMGSYAIDTPNVENAAQGRTAVVFPYSQYLADLYGTVVIATTGVLSGNADLVRRFVGAMTRTVRYAVDNPDEAGTLVQGKLPTVKGTLVAKTMTLMKPYVTSPALDRDRVTRGIAVLAAAGLAASSLSPDAAIDFGAAAKAG
jgi:NitT/TauT family transport system substrate-binding protein